MIIVNQCNAINIFSQDIDLDHKRLRSKYVILMSVTLYDVNKITKVVITHRCIVCTLLASRLVGIMLQILIIILFYSEFLQKSYQNAFIIPKFHSLCSKLFPDFVTFSTFVIKTYSSNYFKTV